MNVSEISVASNDNIPVKGQLSFSVFTGMIFSPILLPLLLLLLFITASS
jgi:hypothetical protein